MSAAVAGGGLVIAGRVVPMAGGGDAEAVMIRGGVITDVGSRELIDVGRGLGYAIHDLGDSCVLPGFVDPHVHMNLLAESRARGVDCRVESCPSIDDVLARLSEAAPGVTSDSGWLEGYGNLFFGAKLSDGRLPTRDELDRVSRRIPIVLHCGGHASVLNSAALERSSLERVLSGAAGGWGTPVVELDGGGRPTGLVAEIDQLLPIPRPDASLLTEELARTYRDRFLCHGVTAFGEMAGSLQDILRMDELIAGGRMQGRGFAYPMVPSALDLAAAIDWAARHRSRSGADAMRVCGVKLFADGGYSSYNAAVRTPFRAPYAVRPGSLGQLNLTYPEILQAIESTRAHGQQLAIHANGERAQDEVVDAAIGAGPTYKPPVVRVEHAGNLMTDRRVLRSWRRAAIVPVLQPGFLYDFVGDFVPEVLGEPALRGRLPLRTLLDDGIRPAASSDVGPANADQQSNPLFSVQTCVQRLGFRGEEIEPEERITVREALRLHTIDAARALGMDDRIGSLEPGKLADVVVFDEDPRTISVDALHRLEAQRVYVGGRVVHAAGAPLTAADGAPLT